MAPAVVGDGETREEVRGIGERRQHSHSTPKAERRERPRLAAHRPPPTTRQNGPGPARRGSAACGWAGCWRWRAGRRLSTAAECSPLMMMVMVVMAMVAMDSIHCTHCTACYRSLMPQPTAQPRYGLPPLPPKAAPAAPPVSRRFSCNQLRLTLVTQRPPAEPLLPFCPVPRQPWFARCAAVPPSFLPSSAFVPSLPVTPPGSSELLAIGVTLPANHLTWAPRHHHHP
jgi:hypothetical protein